MSKLDEIRNKIDTSLKSKSKEDLDKLRESTNLDIKDIFDAQNLQARLFASGKIPLEIAQYTYNNLNHYDTISLTERFLLLQLLKELTQLSIKMRLNKNG